MYMYNIFKISHNVYKDQSKEHESVNLFQHNATKFAVFFLFICLVLHLKQMQAKTKDLGAIQLIKENNT